MSWCGEMISDYERMRAARRHNRKGIAHVDVRVQTYRVWVTLECGHEDTFTLSRKAYEQGAWKTRKLECNECAIKEYQRDWLANFSAFWKSAHQAWMAREAAAVAFEKNPSPFTRLKLEKP